MFHLWMIGKKKKSKYISYQTFKFLVTFGEIGSFSSGDETNWVQCLRFSLTYSKRVTIGEKGAKVKQLEVHNPIFDSEKSLKV